MTPPYPPPQPGPAPPPTGPQPAQPSVTASAEHVVDDVKKEVPKNVSEFERLPLPMMAIVGGGFVAIGLGFLVMLVELVWTPFGFYYYENLVSRIICTMLRFAADIVLGIGLLYCYVLAKKGNWYRAMWMSFVIGVLLLIFGNGGGALGGIFGLIGGVLIFIDPNLRHLGEPGYVAPTLVATPYPPPAYGPPPPPQAPPPTNPQTGAGPPPPQPPRY